MGEKRDGEGVGNWRNGRKKKERSEGGKKI